MEVINLQDLQPLTGFKDSYGTDIRYGDTITYILPGYCGGPMPRDVVTTDMSPQQIEQLSKYKESKVLWRGSKVMHDYINNVDRLRDPQCPE